MLAATDPAHLRPVTDPRAADAHPVDVHVGARIRLRRKAQGISQQQLAATLDLTFQQVQKYERGSNRVSCSKLFQIAAALAVPVEYFFDDLPVWASDITAAETTVKGFMLSPEGLELAQTFPNIKSPDVRRRILALVKTMAEEASA